MTACAIPLVFALWHLTGATNEAEQAKNGALNNKKRKRDK